MLTFIWFQSRIRCISSIGLINVMRIIESYISVTIRTRNVTILRYRSLAIILSIKMWTVILLSIWSRARSLPFNLTLRNRKLGVFLWGLRLCILRLITWIRIQRRLNHIRWTLHNSKIHVWVARRQATIQEFAQRWSKRPAWASKRLFYTYSTKYYTLALP